MPRALVNKGLRLTLKTLRFFTLMAGWFIAPIIHSEPLRFSTLDWCPFVCPQDKEKPGVLVEYIQAVFKNTPYQLKISVYPWSRAIKYTQSGETLALLGPAKEEAPDLIFPQTEIGQQKFCFFTHKDDPWLFTEPISITGRVISVPQDAFPAELNEFRHKAQFLIKPHNKDYVAVVLGMLAFKRINTILLTYNSMMEHLRDHPKLASQVKFANCASKQNLYLAFTPIIEKRAKVKEVMAVFEREIALLREQGFLETLLKKYQLN